jgi:hypothetical protein
VQNISKHYTKELMIKKQKAERTLKAELKKTTNHPNYKNSDELQNEADILYSELAGLKHIAATNAQITATTRYALMGETASKYWLRKNLGTRSSPIILASGPRKSV